MSGVPYHAWTHRPKAEGGTDPIEKQERNMEFAWIKSLEIQIPAAETIVEVILVEGAFVAPDEEPVYDLIENGIQILLPGVYWIRGRVNWSGYREIGNSYVECPQGIVPGRGDVQQDTFDTTVANIHLLNENLPYDVKMNVWHDFAGTPNLAGLIGILRLGAFSGDRESFNQF